MRRRRPPSSAAVVADGVTTSAGPRWAAASRTAIRSRAGGTRRTDRPSEAEKASSVPSTPSRRERLDPTPRSRRRQPGDGPRRRRRPEQGRTAPGPPPCGPTGQLDDRGRRPPSRHPGQGAEGDSGGWGHVVSDDPAADPAAVQVDPDHRADADPRRPAGRPPGSRTPCRWRPRPAGPGPRAPTGSLRTG